MSDITRLSEMRGAFLPIDQNRALSMLIQADAEAGLTAFGKAFKAKQIIKSVYAKEIPITGYPYYPFRFKGHQWTNVVLGDYLERQSKVTQIAESISNSLKSRVLWYLFSTAAGVLQYRLYDSGELREIMSCDASRRLRIITKREVAEIAEQGTKPGFYFYSDVRKVGKSELRDENVIEFVSDFFRSQDALLYLAVEWDMKTSQFKLSRGSESDLDRVDLVISNLRGIRPDD